MRSTPTAAILALVITGGLAYAFVSWNAARERSAREAMRAEQLRADAERAAALREQIDTQFAPVREASEHLMPDALEGAVLGMTRDALLERRELRPKRGGDRPTMSFFEEMLPSGAQVVYGVDDDLDVLTQVQIMSSIPPSGVAPHLEAMIAQYGDPTGIWNCPASGAAGVPMRRFTWRAGAVALQDILLVHPAGVSQTLYITTSETVAASLRISHCQRVRTREELDALPVASSEQVRRVVEATGTGVVFDGP
ncbi:MAG: hypothetical protein AAF411_11275 [Myxococcota bacterium]